MPQRSDKLPENGVGLVNVVHDLILNNHRMFTEIAELVRCCAGSWSAARTIRGDRGRRVSSWHMNGLMDAW